MRRYVIDACVAVKWCIREPLYDEARILLSQPNELFAQDLIWLECLNAILRKTQRGELSREDGWEAFLTLHSFSELITFPTVSLLDDAYQIAAQMNHALYDCIYLALALKQDAKVITADNQFYKRTSTTEYKQNILWISDPSISS